MLTVEELMRDRYKVIAPYPGMKTHGWKVGDILDRNWCEYENGDEEAGVIEWQISDCPANFQPLPWWSERAISDLPAYVKVIREDCSKDTGLFCKVHKWHLLEDIWPTLKGQLGAELEGYYPSYLVRTELNFPGQVYGRLNATHLLPATLAEYEAYNQQKEGRHGI